MKKVSIIGALALGILLLPVIINLLGWLGYGLSLSFDRPPAPEIKYGEFPFKLTYEINGETKVIEDVIVCEFDGYESSGDGGKNRSWKTTLENNSLPMPDSDGYMILVDCRQSEVLDSQGNKVLEIYFLAGNAGYYMGDNSLYTHSVSDAQELDRLHYLYHLEDGSVRYGKFSSDEAYEKVGIRLINWEGSDRIENTFPGQS